MNKDGRMTAEHVRSERAQRVEPVVRGDDANLMELAQQDPTPRDDMPL